VIEPLVAQAPVRDEREASLWRDPQQWLRAKNLGRGYWVFFSTAFFYDTGFCIYFFLFNLYLLDCGFNERAMGWIGGSFTLGLLAGTLRVEVLAWRFGVRRLLLAMFATAPILNAARAAWTWEPAQIGLAILAGLSMSIWIVCFLPAVARLTSEKNRTTGIGLIFSVGVGSSMIGGIVCGYLRDWLARVGVAMPPAEVKRLILIFSCAIAFCGFFPTLRLRLPEPAAEEAGTERGKRWSFRNLPPFLARFLCLMALWSAMLAAFTPYVNVYFERDLRFPMARIGLLFTVMQLVQFSMGGVAPYLFRKIGLTKGIVATQMADALVLGALAGTRNQALAVALYITFFAAQWISSLGLYSLLMNETPDRERNSAAAMTMFVNSVSGAAATALAGALFTRFGYPPVLLGLALMAAAAPLLFRFLVRAKDESTA
jgi:predicted MFS family arabinose efflux permease